MISLNECLSLFSSVSGPQPLSSSVQVPKRRVRDVHQAPVQNRHEIPGRAGSGQNELRVKLVAFGTMAAPAGLTAERQSR
jgi:hypothetical protein